MRWNDAPHVDVGPFLARRPALGQAFRLLGHAGAAGAAVSALLAPLWLPWLLGALVAVWLVAWRLAVGGLWRSSLVSAMAVCAAALLVGAGR